MSLPTWPRRALVAHVATTISCLPSLWRSRRGYHVQEPAEDGVPQTFPGFGGVWWGPPRENIPRVMDAHVRELCEMAQWDWDSKDWKEKLAAVDANYFDVLRVVPSHFRPMVPIVTREESQTIGDRIRTMADEKLAKGLWSSEEFKKCCNLDAYSVVQSMFEKDNLHPTSEDLEELRRDPWPVIDKKAAEIAEQHENEILRDERGNLAPWAWGDPSRSKRAYDVRNTMKSATTAFSLQVPDDWWYEKQLVWPDRRRNPTAHEMERVLSTCIVDLPKLIRESGGFKALFSKLRRESYLAGFSSHIARMGPVYHTFWEENPEYNFPRDTSSETVVTPFEFTGSPGGGFILRPLSGRFLISILILTILFKCVVRWELTEMEALEEQLGRRRAHREHWRDVGVMHAFWRVKE